MNNITDMDPLTAYDAYTYTNYEHVNHNGYNNMYNVKMEPPPQLLLTNVNQYLPMYPQCANNEKQNQLTEQNNDNQENNVQNQEEIDTKEHIKLLPEPKKRVSRKKGKTSSYWNKKIDDKNFPFYGCTICNVSFTTINDLDQHVTIHKGRVTSYDIRVRNQMKRKEKLKQMKRLKKLGKKLKKETELTVEIKPEDGYIGNEKASEFKPAGAESDVKEQSESLKEIINDSKEKSEKKSDVSKKEKVPEDPRLQKLFQCFACHKQFALSYYLKLHVRSHTDEKPYTCAECGQSFITASKLGRHTKRIHLAVRFQCRICYRYFSRFDILTRHFDKVHTEEKLEGEPYDYNAILPYLKELEEQLKEKVEAESKIDVPVLDVDKPKVEDEKPNAGDVWTDWPGQDDDMNPDTEHKDHVVAFDNPYLKDDKDRILPIENIIVENVCDIEVKVEKETESEENFKEESFRDDSFSDEDYFPSNTWAATPKVASPPPTPTTKANKGDFPMKCEFCDKLISTQSYYKVHLRTHSGEKPFKCYICDRGFITSSKMHRHVLTHTEYWEDGEKKLKEENDPEIQAEKESQKKGTKNKKSKKGPKSPGKRKVARKPSQRRPHSCAFCNKRFLHLELLQVHKKCHEGEILVLKCSYCLEVMADEEALKSHEECHSGPRPYLCTVCGRSYTKRETMIYHRKTHEENSEKRSEFICDVCSKTFNAQCKLQRHLASHSVDKFVLKYECPVCAHMFNTRYHIKMHLTTHQKEGLILEENRSDILAMVLQNARKIPIKQDCSMSVSTRDTTPTGELNRVCNICGLVFQHFYYLEEHLKSHGSKIVIEDEEKAEEKKHICPICNKGFKLHYYLKLHSFTHSKEKPYICQSCGKGFITKGKLKRHLETHSGLKKYQCHICYKFFTRPSYLRIHVRTIHGKQDFRMDSKFLGLGESNL